MSLTKNYLELDNQIIEAKATIKSLTNTVKRLEGRRDKIKMDIIQEYTDHGVLPDDGLIMKSIPPKPIILDEKKLPGKYWRVKHEVNKAEINKDIKDGVEIEGVAMDNGGMTIAIKGQ